ncbi:MAG: kinase [Clostridioides sp.]|jgi:hypothetical protein|nr:kinase [Clostridioides sp.]
MDVFDINGAIIKFDSQMENYNGVRKMFEIRAREAKMDFVRECMKSYNSVKQIADKAYSLAEKYIEPAFKLGVEEIVEFEVMTIDVYTFKSRYCDKYIDSKRLFSNYNKRYLTQNKGKNNYCQNSIDIKSVASVFGEYVYEDFFRIHLAVIDALIDNGVFRVKPNIDEETIAKSNAIYNNYRDGFIKKTDEPTVIKQIIELNPYREDLYKFLIEENGDLFMEIEGLTDYLGIPIAWYKEELMDKYVDELLAERQKKNDSYGKMVEKIEKYARYIGFRDSNIYLAKLEAACEFANA